MSKLNIIINGKIEIGHKGESVLELARRLNINIPTLCHDPRLEPFSSCYLCVVEIEGMRGLQPACSTKLVEGMSIETDNERVNKSRKFALDLLVSNHYADCVAPCKEKCPAGVDVQGYISLINKGKYREATGLIKNTNPLPAICGRVCVRPCEVACRRNFIEDVGVGIDYLKRFTSDIDLFSENRYMPTPDPATGKKVAIIGAGPGGLSAAYFMACKGHTVEIFESTQHPGGMLRYGIPPYRLPNQIIDMEVEGITSLGVKIHYNHKLGDNLSYQTIKANFDAVILAIGSQIGTGIGCEDDDAENIFSGIDFLRNMEITGQKYDFKGKKIGVIGGGNTAMDCCRTAIRCGSKDVTVIYRRTEKEMPANPIEIHESKLEGVNYLFLTAPAKVNKNPDGTLKSLSCYRMELGEPDASGRQRPVKIDNSEFEIQLDYILAAIGQKTNVDFLNNINSYSETELRLNKWGDIDADPKTLQTSIPSVFACGDGVTGPATLIEAIAQARLAAQSCHKFLSGKVVTPPDYEFISRRDNFKTQVPEDFAHFYKRQVREEMPTLDPKSRDNFEEVELGYSPQQAINETNRCIECGCSEYYSCDLKKYATLYGAKQNTFKGEYKTYQIETSHPYIEIDNNKCILCSRCIRICAEVVGANALGLVNRGFETYVAPGMNNSLVDTNCESCGMCISTCPTGAITENVPFKLSPIKLESFKSICNYCSVGCEVEYHHKNGFVTKVTGGSGLINKDRNLCRFARFGYKYLNDKNRITQPLLKDKDTFKPISFEEAYKLIICQLKEASPIQNAFFAGARLTNEELYLIQKLARAGFKTNNISSFHYLNYEDKLRLNGHANVPFDQLTKAGRIYLLGSEINIENGVAGFFVYNSCFTNNIPLTIITTKEKSSVEHKADYVVRIKSYYHFIKAAIYYLLENGLENSVYVNDHCDNFDQFKRLILQCNFESLVNESGANKQEIINFATEYNNEPNSVILFAEMNLSPNTCTEINNLSMITGKTGKTAAGVIGLKEKNNSQGLIDMGCYPGFTLPTHNDYALKSGTIQAPNLDDAEARNNPDLLKLLEEGHLKNVMIFGEDPVGCAINRESIISLFSKVTFMVVQDYFMTETARLATLVLPASLPFESGGSFTNTQRFIQQFEPVVNPASEHISFKQLIELHKKAGLDTPWDSPQDVLIEAIATIKKLTPGKKGNLTFTSADKLIRYFENGADSLQNEFVKSSNNH